MWFPSLFARRSGSGRCRSARRNTTLSRPAVEPLEDRTVPSTFTVHSLADSGPGSLRNAILAANASPGADVIRFARAVRGTIALTGGELNVTDDLRIDGPGAGRLTVSGGHAGRVLRVDNADVAVTGLTIADGLAREDIVTPLGLPLAAGGGILNNGGRLALARVTLSGNQAAGLIALGGAVANLSGATLNLTECNFRENAATGEFLCGGGGIGQDDGASAAIERCTFTANRAVTTGGGGEDPLQGAAVGGAIASAGGSRLRVSRGEFAGNEARGGDGQVAGQHGGEAVGGAILCTGIGLFALETPNAVCSIEGSTFVNNRVRAGNGGPGAAGGNGSGGAVDGGAFSDGVVAHCLFLGNEAIGGNGGDGGPGGVGQAGAVVVSQGSSLALSTSAFLFNHATGGRGGDGQSGGHGGDGIGGAFVNGGSIGGPPPTASISGCVFLGNRAVGGVGGSAGGDGGDGHGGAVANDPFGRNSALSISDSYLAGNAALGGAAGSGGSAGDGIGGGIFNLGAVDIDLLTAVVANHADSFADRFGC